jgi:DNA invertase Pin-like site-specific DNA recombinase
MSTEHQRYSTENQADAIAAYAARRGFLIVRTYADEGKSGLSLSGRTGLRQLLTDVERGKTDFSAVIAYDISRWGRFQDADESAYYEHVCKRAGIAVHYCAEQFENDGSLTATVIKSMKRAMAGEYSRELSTKVFIGHCRLVELGYRQGGSPGYGLRRQLLDEQGEVKAILAHGERKSLQTDRVVLVPGPPDEIETVRRIHRMFSEEGAGESRIAAVLNEEKLGAEFGRPWTRAAVLRVLTSEKYAGHNVYNHVSFKLKRARIRNPAEMWIRANNVFPAIIDAAGFAATQAIIQARAKRLTDEEMLDLLSALLRERGTLSAIVIDEAAGLPSSSTYRARFGSLFRAYRLVGFSSFGRDEQYLEINRALRELHPGIVARVIESIRSLKGATVEDEGDGSLQVNGEFSLSIVICRCTRTGGGLLRWKLRLGGSRADITVAVRMQDGNGEILDYYLLPRLDFGAVRLRLNEENGVFLDAYRSESLDRLYRLTARTDVRKAA